MTRRIAVEDYSIHNSEQGQIKLPSLGGIIIQTEREQVVTYDSPLLHFDIGFHDGCLSIGQDNLIHCSGNGMYRFELQLRVISCGPLIWIINCDKIPASHRVLMETTFNAPNDQTINISTMLGLRDGYSFNFLLRASNPPKSVTIRKGMRILVHRVS